MMRFPLFCVAALLGVAVSAPAQLVIEGRLGRHITGSVVVAHRGHDHHSGHRHDDGHRHRDDDRGHRHGRRSHSHGHWKVVEERVLVPGYWSEEHVPPTYGWIVDSCGHRRWGVIDRGGCRRVWVPARYEMRSRRVWCPA